MYAQAYASTAEPRKLCSPKFQGYKNFNTGGVVSDLTVLEGVYEDTDSHIFAFAPTQQPGIQFAVSLQSTSNGRIILTIVQHNWNNIGLRLTESGSVRIDHVVVPWRDALGWDPTTKKPIEAVLNIPWATLLLPTYATFIFSSSLSLAARPNDLKNPTCLLQFLPRHCHWCT